HLEIKITTDSQLNRTVMLLRGAATFLSLPRLAEELEAVPANSELHIQLEDLEYIGHACLELLVSWENQHKSTGGHLVMDWGKLGAMFRDRRRRPRLPGSPSPPAETETAEPEGIATVGINHHQAE